MSGPRAKQGDSLFDHPEALYGVDGEPPHFVRADLASTPQEAAEYLARLNEMTVEQYGRGMDPVEDIKLVWMIEHPALTQHDPDFECEEDDCDCRDDEGQYDGLSEWQPGAVQYWRWSW